MKKQFNQFYAAHFITIILVISTSCCDSQGLKRLYGGQGEGREERETAGVEGRTGQMTELEIEAEVQRRVRQELLNRDRLYERQAKRQKSER